MANPTNWNFYDSDGNAIAQGWQGYDYQARKKAQEFADARDSAVEYCEYGHEVDEDGEPVTGEVVEPA